MLIPVEGMSHVFRNSETGQVFNMRDFSPLDVLLPFDRWRLKSRNTPYPGEVKTGNGVSWVLHRWSIVMHPWPELIPSSLNVKLTVNCVILADVPLFSVAEALQKPEDDELRERIKNIEERLGLTPPSNNRIVQPARIFNQNHVFMAEVYGDSDAFTQLREMTKTFSLRLMGLQRELFEHKPHLADYFDDEKTKHLR